MKLEIKILAILFATFLLLNIILNDSPTDLSKKKVIILENTSNNQIEDSEFIMKQITQNKTSKEITNLSKKDDLVLQEELEEKNKIFLELTQNNSNETITNESK